jgi:hypothetical protein
MFRQPHNYLSHLIPVVLEFMTEFEDDEDWYTTDDVSVILDLSYA